MAVFSLANFIFEVFLSIVERRCKKGEGHPKPLKFDITFLALRVIRTSHGILPGLDHGVSDGDGLPSAGSVPLCSLHGK